MSFKHQQLFSAGLNNLIENLDGAILLEDDQRNILSVNQEFCNLFQIPAPPKALIGINCNESAEQSKHLFAEPENFVTRITEILQKRQVTKKELLKMADGRILGRSYYPIFIESQYKGHFWSYLDVTHSIRANEQLKENEEKLRLILDNTVDAVIGIDSESRITLWNAQAEKIFGWTRQEAIGEKMGEMIIPVQHREGHRKGMERFFKTFTGPVLHNRIEITALKRSGEEFPIELTIIPNEVNGRYFFTGFIRDITSRKEAQSRQLELLDQLEKANRNLQDFAYIVSHDLKAPLRGIASLASWITTDYEDKLDEEGKMHLQLLQSRVDRMHRLIEGILEYSRIDKGNKTKDWVSLQDVIGEVIELLAPSEEVEITINAPLPELYCNKVQILQVFQNLIVNAIKYNDKPAKKINIGCTKTPKYFKITVNDNGIGIDEKYHDKIFQVFQTLHNKEEYDSTGIGLSLVKKIIESCGGYIHLQSTPGEGSTFTLILPQNLVKS